MLTNKEFHATMYFGQHLYKDLKVDCIFFFFSFSNVFVMHCFMKFLYAVMEGLQL